MASVSSGELEQFGGGGSTTSTTTINRNTSSIVSNASASQICINCSNCGGSGSSSSNSSNSNSHNHKHSHNNNSNNKCNNFLRLKNKLLAEMPDTWISYVSKNGKRAAASSSSCKQQKSSSSSSSESPSPPPPLISSRKSTNLECATLLTPTTIASNNNNNNNNNLNIELGVAEAGVDGLGGNKKCSSPIGSRASAASSGRSSPSPTNVCARSAVKTKCPLRLDQLRKYYEENARDGNIGFCNEFNLLERLCRETVYKQMAQVKYASAKNRYANVMPYELTRVKLKSIPDEPDSDYINASFVPGIHSDHEYIACQAPLRETLDDFYRMLLEHKVAIVVNLLERENPSYFPAYVGADDQLERQLYYVPSSPSSSSPSSSSPSSPKSSPKSSSSSPSSNDLIPKANNNKKRQNDNLSNNLINHVDQDDQFGQSESSQQQPKQPSKRRVRIRVHHIERRDCFTIRQIHFLDAEADDTLLHRVAQFHFTKWIDFGTPDNARSLLELVQAVRAFIAINAQNAAIRDAPIVVHCNAGIGRTGTYIAVDQLWQTLSTKNGTGSNHISGSGSGGSSEWGRKLFGNLLKLNSPKPSVDIYGLIYRLRGWRYGLVQTENQFAFIHECVLYIYEHKANLLSLPPVVDQITPSSSSATSILDHLISATTSITTKTTGTTTSTTSTTQRSSTLEPLISAPLIKSTSQRRCSSRSSSSSCGSKEDTSSANCLLTNNNNKENHHQHHKYPDHHHHQETIICKTKL